MTRTLYYLFDPLCGWCYGAGSALTALSQSAAVQLKLLPSGLFQDAGARPMDDAFAAYAWSNDQRIERLTGQHFSQRYREQVLGDRGQMFDSGPATLALTAVWLTAPGREVEALKAIQHARYVEGRDVTQLDVLRRVLDSLDLVEAAQWLQAPDDALRAAARSRIDEAQTMMSRFGARGVPSFVLDSGDHQELLDASTVYPDPRAFLDQLAAPLQWRALPAGERGFFRAPVLLSGAREAILIDGGFSLPDGRAAVEAIRASGKTLTTIYISQSDPDYYFSLGPVKAAFPAAKVIAASATIAAIKANVEKKLAVWGPQLKENGPQALADIVMPEAFDGDALDLEGHRIEIVAAQGMENRRYLWVPSLQAVFGGVLVFAGLHVWTADTPTPQARAAWVGNLEAIAARAPAVVVPGHMAVDAAPDVSAVNHTRDYLLAFEEEVAKAADSAALIAAMKQRYPSAGMVQALEIGAKVVKGEMKWG